MVKPDILVFMSDQHSPVFSAFDGGPARTPNLDRLCEEGTCFDSAYTSCPLCVPARVSMLLGKLPTNTGVFTNEGAIPETSATFLHSLVAAGYETVLVGRMHFIGSNQRHGFTKRLVGDMTPVTWNRPAEKLARERGVFQNCFAEPGAVSVIGGGESPVLEYDKEVISKAIDYLAERHDKPQCIFVSTYGPHFPYVAPYEAYLYYKDKINVPQTFYHLPDYMNPPLMNKVINVPEETVIKARAAYFGMIETIDAQMGSVRAAFNKFSERNGRERIFVYISDHGDQAGDRRLFGKNTFFETSSRIPLIFEGSGINKGLKVNTPASIMDLGPTLCELAGANKLPLQDGKSLACNLWSNSKQRNVTDIYDDRAVISELLNMYRGHLVIARMVRKRQYKYITYIGFEEYDILFDLDSDPEEMNNIANKHPQVLKELKEEIFDGWDPEKVMQQHSDYIENIRLVQGWEKVAGIEEERWNKNPESARVMPRTI